MCTDSKSQIKGFTLIEVLVSIGVVMIIAGISISSFITLTSAYDKADVVTKVNHEGLRITEQLVRLIRTAEDANVSSAKLILTIPQSPSNLEYASNGGCSTVEIYRGGLSSEILHKETKNCTGTPACPYASLCELTSSEVRLVDTTDGFEVSVVNDSVNPDKVTFNFKLTTSGSLSDIDGTTVLEFNRTVVTRGY